MYRWKNKASLLFYSLANIQNTWNCHCHQVFLFFPLLYMEGSFFLLRHIIVPLLQDRFGEVSFGSHQNNMMGDNMMKSDLSVPFSRDKTMPALVSSALFTHQHNTKTAAIKLFWIYMYVSGLNDPPSLRFQGVTDNLNTPSSFIICQPNFSPAFLLRSLSCYVPLIAQISSFPLTCQILPRTHQVPLLCFHVHTPATEKLLL